MDIALNCVLIFSARVVDVALGTLRTLTVVRGNRLAAWLLGFVEILIWVLVVSKVIQSVREMPIYAVFYAMGFATGGYVGMTIERRLAFGERAVLLFTRKGQAVADIIRQQDYMVTQWQAMGKDGPISLVFSTVPRRDVRAVIGAAKAADPGCFYVVESVDRAFDVNPTVVPKTGWRAQARKAK